DARAGAIVTFFLRKKPRKNDADTCLLPGHPGNPIHYARRIKAIDLDARGLMASGSHSDRIQATPQLDPSEENSVRKISAIACVVFLSVLVAEAQIPTSGNVFFGYSYSHGNAFTSTFSPPITPTSPGIGMSGWEASLEGKFLPWIGIVADFDWH